MTAYFEAMADEIIERHGLSGIHFFVEKGKWRAFGFRAMPGDFQAASEWGEGKQLATALDNLDDLLTQGPIRK